MGIALSNPTFVSDKAREGQIASFNTALTSSPAVANPLLRIRRDSTTLVDFPLNATTPLTLGAVDGSATYNFTSANAVATGGANTLANNWQLIGRDSVVHTSGPAESDQGITVGQVVNTATITTTAPAT